MRLESKSEIAAATEGAELTRSNAFFWRAEYAPFAAFAPFAPFAPFAAHAAQTARWPSLHSQNRYAASDSVVTLQQAADTLAFLF